LSNIKQNAAHLQHSSVEKALIVIGSDPDSKIYS